MSNQTLSIALSDAEAQALAEAADALGVAHEDVARQALQAFFTMRDSHAAHINRGVRQADAGTFVDEADWRAALKPRA